MDWNGGKSLVLTKMSPGFDNWRRETQYNFTHSKPMPPYRNATEPRIVPENFFRRLPTIFVGGKGVEGLKKESEKGNMIAVVDGSSTNNNIKVANSFKFFLIEHIREVLKPYWKQGNLSRDAYKIISKKAVDKIMESIEASKFPRTKVDQQRYLSASESKIFEFIKAYVKKYQKNTSILKSVCLALHLRLQDPFSVTWKPELLILQDFISKPSLRSLWYHKMFTLNDVVFQKGTFI